MLPCKSIPMKLKNILGLTAYFMVAYGLVAAVMLANDHLRWIDPPRLFICLYPLPFLGIVSLYFAKYRKLDKWAPPRSKDRIERR